MLKLRNFLFRPIGLRQISNIQSLLSNINNETRPPNDMDEEMCEKIISATQKMKIKPKIDKLNRRVIQANPQLRLRHYLHCSDEEANEMIKNCPELEDIKAAHIEDAVESLYKNDITRESVISNPYLLTMTGDTFIKKIQVLKKFKHRNINDLVPLLQCSMLSLTRAYKFQEMEEKIIPYGSRIYYLSKHLNINPVTVSKYLSTHMFMFTVPFENIKQILETLFFYDIEPMHILKDLWVFKYLPEKVKNRLEFARQNGRTGLRPWMCRCKIRVLERSIELSQGSKEQLGGDTNLNYIAKRLNCDIETMKAVVDKHPYVLKCRGGKVKQVLDFLLNEAKYEPYQIIHSIRILIHSLETTKERVNEVKRLGCYPVDLSVICRSKKMYQKYIDDWLARSERNSVSENV